MDHDITHRTPAKNFNTADESQQLEQAVRRVNALARLLDEQFRIPGTHIRFGLDPIVGLVPGLGDSLTAFASLYIVAQAVRFKLGFYVIVRMLVNIFLDWFVGLIPVLDIFLDTAVKSNIKNARLFEKGAGSMMR